MMYLRLAMQSAAVILALGTQEAARAQDVELSNSVRADVNQTVAEPKPQVLDTDLLALMSGRCSTLKVDGRDFACRAVAYAHSVQGRANFTIVLDDAADQHHIISFSGNDGQRTADNLYHLTIDRVLLNSSTRPKVDGLPVPVTVASAGRCVQLGNFAAGHVSSVVCSATDKSGKEYQLRFESDGSPITVRRVRPSAPTIPQPS